MIYLTILYLVWKIEALKTS